MCIDSYALCACVRALGVYSVCVCVCVCRRAVGSPGGRLSDDDSKAATPDAVDESEGLREEEDSSDGNAGSFEIRLSGSVLELTGTDGASPAPAEAAPAPATGEYPYPFHHSLQIELLRTACHPSYRYP